MSDEKNGSTVPMRAPKNAASTISHGGKTITADKFGIFTVPAEAVETLLRHGFQLVEQKS